MKRFFLLFLAVAAVSCVKNPNITPDPVVTTRLTTVEKFSVPIKDGYTSVVKLGSDTLCVATSATSIWIPKNASVSTKASQIQISYIEGTDPKAGTSQMWQTIGFEDSEVGDYDYNDIVIHVKHELKKNILGIGIHPVALGSTKVIALGCKVFEKDVLRYDQLVSNNCRQDLFEGITGFINTSSVANFHTNFFKKIIKVDLESSANMSDIKVIWYIKVDGGKYFYSVNDHYGYLDENKRPYGLIITDTGNTYYQDDKNPEVGGNWFPYPYEGVNINTAFPTFNAWITGAAEYCDMKTSVSGTAIEPGTYMYNRPDSGPTRVYHIVKNVL